MSLMIDKPGIATYLVSKPRTFHTAIGLPVGGPADELSYRIVNQLLHNSHYEKVLEFMFPAPEIVFNASCHIALGGGDFYPTIDGKKVSRNKVIAVKAGSRLVCKRPILGARMYLGISGNWLVDRQEENFRINRKKSIDIQLKSLNLKRSLPLKYHRSWETLTDIEVWPGPEYDSFNSSFLEKVQDSSFTVSAQSNRMAVTVDEIDMISLHRKAMISSPVMPGTVQINRQGLPMILLADGQTIGGYPRLFQVADAAMWKIAQLKAGDRINFLKL